jgi:hypothetical protein
LLFTCSFGYNSTRCYYRHALFQIGADLLRVGGRVVHQLVVDGGHVSINECNAALNFGIGETVLGQIAALEVELGLERALVGEVVVEVALGDSNNDFASAARGVHSLAFLASEDL